MADALAKTLVDRALEFHARRLWAHVPSDAPFLIRLPAVEHPFLAVIVGQAGENFGLTLYLGPDVLAQFHALITNDDESAQHRAGARMSSILLSFDPISKVPHELRALSRAAGYRPRPGGTVPSLFASDAGLGARSAKRGDARTMALVLAGILATDDAGALHPKAYSATARRLLEVRVEGELDVERVSHAWVPAGATQAVTGDEQSGSLDFADEAEVTGIRAAAPHDHASWREADVSLAKRLVREFRISTAPEDLAEYFGADEAYEVDASEEHEVALFAYMDWAIQARRARRGGATVLERALRNGGWSEVELALLEARRQATLTFLRVDEAVPGGGVTTFDLVAERTFISEGGELAFARPGLILPVRLTPIDGNVLVSPAGPTFSVLQADPVFGVLRKLGLELTPSGVQARPELFGRLWAIVAELARVTQRQAPRLTNTDGDPLEPERATFRVGDPGALLDALGSEEEFDQVEDRQWVWRRPGAPGTPPPRTRPRGKGARSKAGRDTDGPLEQWTVLARLELVLDELVVEVNSRARLAHLRTRLAAVPGVEFVSSRSIEPSRSATPLDTRLGQAPAKPEQRDGMREAIEEHLRSHYLRWLDERLPMFGGRTPREFARTREGRERVRVAIQTMPSLPTPGGTAHPPREELLRALGL